MSQSQPLTVLCVTSYEKGQDFMRECKRQGCRVVLITVQSLENANWPSEALDDVYYMPDGYQREDIIKGVSYLARTVKLDRIVALDDFEIETAAALREHLRVPGMGDTTARHFRDKLAMRVKAQSAGIRVPDFVHALNYEAINEYVERVPPPWVLKPRSEASAIGIKKVHTAQELWPILHSLGDKQSYYVLEHYIAGDVYHVDSIVSENDIVFAVPHKYGAPPMNTAHEGGVFITRSLPRDGEEAQALLHLNQELLAALGLVRGVTHAEFIRGHEDGRYYFLETAARVGGANIAEVIEAATGINLWAEWAKVEIGLDEKPYVLPAHRHDYSGILISLARQEHPDTSAYNDAEIVWRMNKKHHAGLIVASPDPQRVEALLNHYAERFVQDFLAVEPLPDKPWA
ncbi:MAG: ATP-grasp domain-containing protein [Acidobacteria bacterium]|nr:ATP-grasp domain-containing protein [Acidobacteriota bacterium]